MSVLSVDKKRVEIVQKQMRLKHDRGGDSVSVDRLGGGLSGSVTKDEAKDLYIALRDFLNVMNDG